MSIAISLNHVSKSYQLYEQEHHRFFEIISGKNYHKTVHALEPLSIDINTGQVLGLIGNNGAGKSTLLKLITETASLTTGTVAVNGRIVALLELGAGFHPDLSGRENIFLYASILGMPRQTIESCYQNIVEFSELGDFIDNPVKTYSSGMFVRLAFSVATAVEPDILIIDEALSVGDGHFANKSFDKIMSFKESGKTIIFCSHSMYHINNICDRVLWLEKGKVIMDGLPSQVVPAYTAKLFTEDEKSKQPEQADAHSIVQSAEHSSDETDKEKTSNTSGAVLIEVTAVADDTIGKELSVLTGQTDVEVKARFISDPDEAAPHFGVTIENTQGYVISSAGTFVKNHDIARDEQGEGEVTIKFPDIPLLDGKFYINAYLLHNNAILVYDEALKCIEINVHQKGQHLGVVQLDYQCA